MAERAAGAVRVDPRGHAAVFGHGPGSLAATAVEVFAAARDSGEALLFMADDPDPGRLAGLADRDALLDSGRLRLIRTVDAYAHADSALLLEAFDATLSGIVAEGWAGMRVVADNTSLARGGDGAFADWLRWEHVTHRWQQNRPVVGVCWFDAEVVSPERRAQLARVHTEFHGSDAPPPFRVLASEGTVRLQGDVDPHEVTRVVDLLAHTPHDGELQIDLADARYLHHTLFTALETSPAGVRRIRLAGASPTVRRVWDVVGDPTGRVELV